MGKAKTPTDSALDRVDPIASEVRYDPATAERAFEASKPDLLAIHEADVEPFRLGTGRAIQGIFGVIGIAKATGVPVLLAQLPEPTFDRQQFSRLERLTWTAWYLERTIAPLLAGKSEAVLAAELLAEANEVRRRMQTCAEYHLMDDPEAAAQLAHLRLGGGHHDLANDLFGYARIYVQHLDILRHDRKTFRESDAQRALELSSEILRLLATPKADALTELQRLEARTWALLAKVYEDVAETARWLHRSEPAKRANYPSLFTLGRKPAPRSAMDSDANPQDAPTIPDAMTLPDAMTGPRAMARSDKTTRRDAMTRPDATTRQAAMPKPDSPNTAPADPSDPAPTLPG